MNTGFRDSGRRCCVGFVAFCPPNTHRSKSILALAAHTVVNLIMNERQY